MLDKEAAAVLQRRHVPLVVAGVDLGHLAEAPDRRRPVQPMRLEISIRAEIGDHPPRPRRIRCQRGVRGQVIAGVSGRGEHTDPEPLVQGAGPEGVVG